MQRLRPLDTGASSRANCPDIVARRRWPDGESGGSRREEAAGPPESAPWLSWPSSGGCSSPPSSSSPPTKSTCLPSPPHSRSRPAGARLPAPIHPAPACVSPDSRPIPCWISPLATRVREPPPSRPPMAPLLLLLLDPFLSDARGFAHLVLVAARRASAVRWEGPRCSRGEPDRKSVV